MLTLTPEQMEALEECLFDLKHDLGKYVKLPLGMLPKDAPWDQVVAQVRLAVYETRKGPRGVISAADLFSAFADEWRATLSGTPSFQGLERAVHEACALPDRVAKGQGAISRDEAERMLGAVSVSIQALMDEVLHG